MDMDMDMDMDTRMSSPTKKRTFPNDLSISTTKGSRSSSRRRLSVCTSHTSKTSSSFDRLTDDLFTEILLRVPVKPLHRSKSVSKRWLSLISSTCFARSYILTDHHNNMLLFKAERSKPYHDQHYALPFLHASYHQLSSIPLTFDFVLPLCRDFYDINDYGNQANNWEVTTKVLDYVFLIGTYGGLVLLSASFQDYHPEKSQYFYYQYYLCNPISKQWAQLPLISTYDSVGFTCYHAQQARGLGEVSRIWADTNSYENIIRNNADYDPNKIDFTVVSINRGGEKDEFIASVFSSTDEAAEWSIFHVPCPPASRWILGPTKLVFLNGNFHWCGTNCIAAYDPFNKPLHCDIIPLPPMDPLESENGRILLLEACQGHLRLVKPNGDGKLPTFPVFVARLTGTSHNNKTETTL
ncbi:uncharacterized protein LOC141605387 [Silene latifolia]|uniref:uncharacterized protein LOC141605387 n=1 Tax=Silene latifolia TaxID=37657 RepID=UPI003D76EBD3